jgi:hypothetical protein
VGQAGLDLRARCLPTGARAALWKGAAQARTHFDDFPGEGSNSALTPACTPGAPHAMRTIRKSQEAMRHTHISEQTHALHAPMHMPPPALHAIHAACNPHAACNQC